MANGIELIQGGSATSPTGFRAGGVFAGLKTAGEGVLDLGILVSDRPAHVAGTFSTNKVLSPSVTVSKSRVARNAPVLGVVANSGCANCAVGEQGLADAEEMTKLAAAHVGANAEDLCVASTGMIGVELPMALIRQSIPNIELTDHGGEAFARSIMTTDTRAKHTAAQFEANGQTYTVGGVAKGVGMIHPDMATMLSFITCDADVEPAYLRSALSRAVDLSFNMIDVDGDQSTNDTVLLFANGAAGGATITEDSPAAEAFFDALRAIATHLAIELVRDGEGAGHVMAVTVDGADTDSDARKAAREISSSNLVKAMVHGRDPNWGRIMMALGKSGVELDESKIDIYVNGIHIVHEGKAIPYYAEAVISGMAAPDVSFRVSLNVGEAAATAWGSDLTEEYVTFNSAYST